MLDPVRIFDELERIRAFGAERSFIDGRMRVALNVNDLAAFGVDMLAAPDRAVRADAFRHGRAFEAATLFAVSAG